MHSGTSILEKKNFKINKVRLIKLTCLGYLQSKLASPRLLGPVGFGWFAPCMLNGEERVLDLTSRSSLWWLNMTVSVDPQLEAMNWSIILGLAKRVIMSGSGRPANPNLTWLAKWVGRVNPFSSSSHKWVGGSTRRLTC
jgi:hypothetical protein